MPFTVSESEKQELAVVFASLVLYDDKVDVSAENISKVLKAANGTMRSYQIFMTGSIASSVTRTVAKQLNFLFMLTF